jgi:hypothetical protein
VSEALLGAWRQSGALLLRRAVPLALPALIVGVLAIRHLALVLLPLLSGMVALPGSGTLSSAREPQIERPDVTWPVTSPHCFPPLL